MGAETKEGGSRVKGTLSASAPAFLSYPPRVCLSLPLFCLDHLHLPRQPVRAQSVHPTDRKH